LLVQIKDEALNLDGMVRNLLAITRIDAGQLELRWDWVDLREIVARVVSAVRRRGAAQKFEINLPSELPLVKADATLVDQAIGNVVANAATHTPPQTTVVIDAVSDAEKIALRVTDDGDGIPAEVLPRAFEKFVSARANVSSTEGREGTGLGLAIAKGIMEAHGGSIAAESLVSNGRGTRITLTFSRPETPS
jgi:two-component system sensor histidine kinase KdpD